MQLAEDLDLLCTNCTFLLYYFYFAVAFVVFVVESNKIVNNRNKNKNTFIILYRLVTAKQFYNYKLFVKCILKCPNMKQ